MRINYAPSTSPTTNPDGTPRPEAEQQSTAEIYARIAARRHPRPLIPLDLALLHSPQVADGYNAFVGAIRSKTTVSEDILELSICRIAVLNGAVYEWNAHAPLALKAGVSVAQLDEVMHTPASTFTSAGAVVDAQRPAGSRLTDAQWETLLFTDAMTVNVRVDDGVFGAIKSRFSERQVVELTACIGAYNLVSRFLVALDVGENNDKPMKAAAEIQAGLTG